MNTNLILTAKSRAAEVLRDERTLKRAKALNGGKKHFENTGGTAARLIGDPQPVTPAKLDRDMEAARKHDLKQP